MLYKYEGTFGKYSLVSKDNYIIRSLIETNFREAVRDDILRFYKYFRAGVVRKPWYAAGIVQ